MNTQWMTAFSGMVGSVVGVSATVAVAWIKQKTLDERELLREEIRKRETLYGEFIGECARLLVDALQHTLEKPETLLSAYALLNRIRLCGSHEVLASAKLLLVRITDQYFSGTRSVQDLRQLAHSTDADPLKEFGEACRLELNALRERKSQSRVRRLRLRRSLDALRRSPISHQTPTLL
jgi:hypothetical protein